MAKDPSESSHDRQNILNNRYALQQAERHLALGGVEFEGETVFTKVQVMALATIERYLSSHEDELESSGYKVFKRTKLNKFNELYFAAFINEGAKTTALELFNSRSVLNLGMSLTESEPACQLR